MVRKTVPMVAFWREKDLSETLSLAGRLLRLPPTSFCRFSTSTLADGKTTKIYSLINTSQVSSRQLPSVSERRLFWKAHWMHLSIRIWACWYRCLSSPSSTSSLLPHHTTSPQEKTKNTYTHMSLIHISLRHFPSTILILAFDNCRREPRHVKARWISNKSLTSEKKDTFQISKTPWPDMCPDYWNFRGARDPDLNFAIWSSLQDTSSIFFHQL